MEPTANKKTINKHTEVQLFETARLCSGEYIRCTENFYSEPMFSNIMISMNEEDLKDYPSDDGNCYGKVVTFIVDKSINYINQSMIFILTLLT
jgi:hypothetical protein